MLFILLLFHSFFPFIHEEYLHRLFFNGYSELFNKEGL